MKDNKIVIGIVASVFILAGLIFWAFKENSYLSFDDANQTYTIEEKWDLPPILEEISGMSYLGNNEMACIQDEDGVIFIYNLETSKITSRIPFGKDGDYEAITVVGDTAYIARSDGKIYKVMDFRGSSPGISTYQISGLDINEMESLEVDLANNRLLFAVKEYNNRKNTKGIYTFDLATETTFKERLFTLDGNDEIYEKLRGGRSSRIIRPSSIRFHPETGELYVLEGNQPKLIILDKNGNEVEIHLLDPKFFPQPEGLAFDENNRLYISNESRRQPGNILRVKLNDN
ncbi:SdiA-regulated domain-containing protein [Salegentibacter sp. JZCK2]|uniref:SdiA-regulated domain-containing protein n=1 Tax=Salegentibacter tibetensis TaxID=2873600 RepID=UPI001CCD34BC|nr:SdiA-regulated domain-containing protein [Salegentibacter tibetensis]MBZ9729720.1 SdiA-regulated domain-containing protein [Salegentibacter tibetensis]